MNTYTIHIKKRHTVVMYYGNMYLLNIFGKVEFYNEKKIFLLLHKIFSSLSLLWKLGSFLLQTQKILIMKEKKTIITLKRSLLNSFKHFFSRKRLLSVTDCVQMYTSTSNQ